MKILHVGCGNDVLPDYLIGKYEETRLDIDPVCNPDVIAPMTDMGDIGGFDFLYTQHALEHIFPHECKIALKEFYRVLGPEGAAIIIVPDLEGVEPTNEILYNSPAGGVCGLDIIYGMSRLIEVNPYMAHKNGFIKETLEAELLEAGFSRVDVKRMSGYNLVAIVKK